MKLVSTVKEMQDLSNTIRNEGQTISFVPTMGSLHEGHLSLVRKAGNLADICAVSIFVNPTQFGPSEDFKKYTRDLDGDISKLNNCGVDIIFAPEVQEIYPKGFQTYVEVEQLGNHLCGLFRKGHFKGVATIVLKLFNIVKPNIALFGEKDYQQLKIIQRMVNDLNLEIEIVSSSIVRDEIGLALSSRNSYLSNSERTSAGALYKALCEIRREFVFGSEISKIIIKSGEQILKKASITDIDYFEICDPETLEIKEKAEKGDLLAIAVRLGGTRIIDNIRL